MLWRDDSVDGVKTGHTDSAGFCLISSAQRNDMRLIAVVAGSESENERLTASQRLLEYGFRFYATQKLVSQEIKVTTAKVWGGKTNEGALGSTKDIYLTLPRTEFKNIKDTNRSSKYNWKKLNTKHDVWSLGLTFLTMYIYRDFYNYYHKYPSYFFLRNGYVSSLILDVITDTKIHDLFTKILTVDCISSNEVITLLENMAVS